MESYKNNFQKAIVLNPTREPGVFSVCLSDGYSVKIIGTYNSANCTFTTFRTEKKHLHRSSGSLAINLQLFSELPNLKWICIIYENAAGKKTELRISKNYLLATGRKSAFKATDYEVQIFLPLQLWGLEHCRRFEMQRDSQLGLFA